MCLAHEKSATSSLNVPGALVNYSLHLASTHAKCLNLALLISVMSVIHATPFVTIKHDFFPLKSRAVFLHTSPPLQPNPPLQRLQLLGFLLPP